MQLNYLQLIQAIKQGQNPQQLLMGILEERMGQTPLGQNLLEMAKNNNAEGMENVARNICAQKGIDYDKEFMSFKQLFN